MMSQRFPADKLRRECGHGGRLLLMGVLCWVGLTPQVRADGDLLGGTTVILSQTKRARQVAGPVRKIPFPGGELWVYGTWIDVPREVSDAAPAPRPFWTLQGDAATVEQTLRDAGLDARQASRVMQGGSWNDRGDEFKVRFPPTWLAGLEPLARHHFFTTLRDGSIRGPRQIEVTGELRRLWAGNLPPEMITVAERLVTPDPAERSAYVVLDGTFEALVTDEAVRQQWRNLLMRTYTLMPYLMLDDAPEAIEEAIAYWQLERFRPETIPGLKAAARLGLPMDIRQVLPFDMSDLAYTFPFARDELSQFPPDCFWTAAAFNDDEPLPLTMRDWERYFRDRYERVATPRYGDVLFMGTGDGFPSHAAVYIADGLLFTKNGYNIYTPWVFESLADLRERYPLTTPENDRWLRPRS